MVLCQSDNWGQDFGDADATHPTPLVGDRDGNLQRRKWSLTQHGYEDCDGGETSRQHAFLSLERALGLEHHEHHFVGRERCAEISIRDVASGVARFG